MCSRRHIGRVWMLPVSQGDFQTVLACVIGTGRVSGLCMWLRSATGRYGVRELGVQIDLSDFYVLDLYMVFPKLNVIIAPIIVCWSPHFTGSVCCCYAGRNGSLFSVTSWRIAPDCPSNPALSSSWPKGRAPFCLPSRPPPSWRVCGPTADPTSFEGRCLLQQPT